MSSFLRDPCTKNYCNWFIFDTVIPKIKRVTLFLGHSVVPTVVKRVGVNRLCESEESMTLDRPLAMWTKQQSWTVLVTDSKATIMMRAISVIFMPKTRQHSRQPITDSKIADEPRLRMPHTRCILVTDQT